MQLIKLYTWISKLTRALLFFKIALELMYEKSQVDLVTGLRTKTQAGRPDFNKVRSQGINDRERPRLGYINILYNIACAHSEDSDKPASDQSFCRALCG